MPLLLLTVVSQRNFGKHLIGDTARNAREKPVRIGV